MDRTGTNPWIFRAEVKAPSASGPKNESDLLGSHGPRVYSLQ